MNRPNFPLIWDNTMRGTLVECPRKLQRSFIEGWAPAQPNVHLHAGGAFAAAIETTRRSFWSDGLSPEVSLGLGAQRLIEYYGTFEPDDRYKNKRFDRMLEALAVYFQTYKLGSDYLIPFQTAGNYCIEFTFAIPIDPSLKHPVTGDEILVAGRFDMLGIHRFQNVLFCVDEKTASQLGAQWANQWDFQGQFTTYCWAARQFGYPVAGAIIRGMGMYATEVKPVEVVTYRLPDRIERWRLQFVRDVKRAIRMWEEGYFDMAEDHACSSFGGCGFREVCFNTEPERRLQSNFTKRSWNPLEKDPQGWKEAA